MLPSFYLSKDKAQVWSLTHAAACGAGIGAVAAMFKTLAPLHRPFASSIAPTGFLPAIPEIAIVAAGFALLCVAAAALRNFIAQRLI